MRYRVRTQEGELDYPSLAAVEQAYAQGLVAPEDEVQEEGTTTWRKAASIPTLARARPTSGAAERAQTLTVLLVVALGAAALVLLFRDSWHARLLGLTLALVASSMLTRVTFKAWRRPPPG